MAQMSLEPRALLRVPWLVFCLLMSGGLWGVTPSLAKIATQDGAHPLGLTLWQGLGGGLLLLVVAVLRGRRVPASRSHLLFYLLCGMLGTAMPTFFTFLTSRHVPAGILSMVIAAVPLFTYALAMPLGIERLSLRRVLGIALGFVAVVLLVAPDREAGSSVATAWLLLALLVPVCYACENMVLALRRPHGDDVTLVTGMLLGSSVLLAPAVLLSGSFVVMQWPPGRVELATAGMVTVNVVSYVFFLHLVRIAGPVFAAQAGYLSMLCGVLAGMLIHGEAHGTWFWLALLCMLVGMALVKERALKAPGVVAAMREPL